MPRRAVCRWAMAGLLAAAVSVFPALALAQTSTIEVTIDAPVTSATISNGQTVDIGGWAVDSAATGGTGIDSVQIFVDVQNGVAAQEITANYGGYRPDVAKAFSRPDWANSGFNITWTPQGLADGQHTVQVWAHSTLGHWNSSNVTVAAVTPVTTTAALPPPPAPQIEVLSPPGMPPAPPMGMMQPQVPPPPPVMGQPMMPPVVNQPVNACAPGPLPPVGGTIVFC